MSRLPAWLLGLSTCLLPIVAAHAQSSVEYNDLRNMDVTVLANNTGGVPDAYGMVGGNQPTGIGVAAPFMADEQRGAFDSMVTGIALYGRSGTISSATCDTYVANGMKALLGAYKLQTSNGDFYDHVTENANGTVTASGSGNGCDNMKFFMAYSNHALLLLANNSHYYGLYSAQIITLLPQIQKTLDFFCANGFGQDSGVGSCKTDKGAPNRDLVCACANGLGSLLLSGYTTQSDWNQNNYQAGNYMVEADKWLDNFMISSSYFASGRPLADTSIPTFIPFEGNVVNGWGYDTSYTGVGLRFLSYYLLNIPTDTHLTTPLVNPYAMVRQQGYFLSTRFFASDPRGKVSGVVVDATNSTRTGPIGGVSEKKTTDEDDNSARFALLYYDAIVNSHYSTSQSTGLTTAQLLNGSYTVVATPSLPAQIVNDPSTLSLTVTTGATITPWPIFASNAGLMNLLSAPTDPGFGITASPLPAGLTMSGVSSYTQVSPNNSGSGNVDQSVGWVALGGTLTAPAGNYAVSLVPKSTVVTYTAATNPNNAPTYTLGSTQPGTARTLNITVVNPPKAGSSADSYVRDGTPDTNYGTATQLQIKSSPAGSGTNRIGYLKFTAPTLPANTVILKAVLQLYGDFGTDNDPTIPIACFGVYNNTWTESGITWNNQPSTSTWTTSQLDSQAVTHTNATWNWNVTSFVKGQVAAGINTISLAITSTDTTTTGGAFFNTKENASSPPALVIYYQTANP